LAAKSIRWFVSGTEKENTLIIELFGEIQLIGKREKDMVELVLYGLMSNFGEKNGLYGKLQRFLDEVFRAKESLRCEV
jgi:alpha-N-acetylglucosaminidase